MRKVKLILMKIKKKNGKKNGKENEREMSTRERGSTHVGACVCSEYSARTSHVLHPHTHTQPHSFIVSVEMLNADVAHNYSR